MTSAPRPERGRLVVLLRRRVPAWAVRATAAAFAVALCVLAAAVPTVGVAVTTGLLLTAGVAVVAAVSPWPWVLAQWALSSVGFLLAVLPASDPVGTAGASALVLAALVAGMVSGWAARHLRAHSPRDPVTGLLSRSGLDLSVDRLYAWSQRQAHPISVAVVDVGTGAVDSARKDAEPTTHPSAGTRDDRLRALAGDWSRRVRAEDVLARIHESTFVLVLPGASRDGAEAVRSRLAGGAAPPRRWGAVEWGPAQDFDEVLALAERTMRVDRTGTRRRRPPAPSAPG